MYDAARDGNGDTLGPLIKEHPKLINFANPNEVSTSTTALLIEGEHC